MTTNIDQPYVYRRRELIEPDWTRLPGYRDVTTEQWESAQWQRAHSVKNLKEFKEALWATSSTSASRRHRARPGGAGHDVDAHPAADDEHDGAGTDDPIRRPRSHSTPTACAGTWSRSFSDRDTEWASHPMASRDSLHEADMWAVEGLTHRYPTKVLAELIPTCPQYCGHCTRMDLVGNDTLQVPSTSSRSSRTTAGSDARLPAPDAAGARRRGLRRRHGERADQAPRGLRRQAARHREHPRHPDRHQGPDGAPAALPAGRRRGRGPDGQDRGRAGSTSPSTPT